MDRPQHVARVDVVADLLALVAEDPVGRARQRHLHQIGEEAVQLDAAVLRAGQAAAPEDADLEAEVLARTPAP